MLCEFTKTRHPSSALKKKKKDYPCYVKSTKNMPSGLREGKRTKEYREHLFGSRIRLFVLQKKKKYIDRVKEREDGTSTSRQIVWPKYPLAGPHIMSKKKR